MAKYDSDEFFSAERNGCIPCPARETCLATYRGSTCAARRSKYGLGDPKTNFDAIHAMNVDELAKRLAWRAECPDKNHMANCTEQCETCWLDWLKSPAEVKK